MGITLKWQRKNINFSGTPLCVYALQHFNMLMEIAMNSKFKKLKITNLNILNLAVVDVIRKKSFNTLIKLEFMQISSLHVLL